VTPSDRTELIAAAKQTALPAARCVAAGVRLDHLLNGKTWHELAALLTVALEAVDDSKLRALCALPGDEGLTPETLYARRCCAGLTPRCGGCVKRVRRSP